MDLRAAAAAANLAAAAVGTAAVYEEQERLAESRRLIAEASEQLASLAGLRDDAGERRGARRARARRLVRDRHRRRRGHDPAARRRPPGPGEGQRREAADRAAADRSRRSVRRLPAVIRTQKPEIMPEFSDAELDERFADRPALLAELRSLGLRSSMTVPLVARGARSARSRSSRPSRRGVTARPTSRSRSSSPGARRSPSTTRSSTARPAQREPGAVRGRGRPRPQRAAGLRRDARGIARLAVPQIADWCIVDIVEGAEIRRVGIAAAADEEAAGARGVCSGTIPPTWDSPQPAAQALSRAVPVILEEFDGAGARGHRGRRAASADPRDARSALRVALPLIARGEKVGAITFAWSQTRRITAARPAADGEPGVAGRPGGRQRPALRARAGDGRPARVPRRDELAALVLARLRDDARPTSPSSSCRSSPTGVRSTSRARTAR